MERNIGHTAAASLAGAILLAGCSGSSTESVEASAVIIDRRLQALTAAGIDFVNGTYTGCTTRTGSWSLRVSGAVPMTNAALSVVQGDDFSACKLAITAVRANGMLLAPNEGPFVLDASYGVSAFSFGSPVDFYANASLGVANFDAPFTVSLLLSDDPALATANTSATYAMVSATAGTTTVAAPDYTLSTAGVLVTATFQKRVAAVTGDLALTAGARTGERYAIERGSVGDAYADIKTVYDAASTSAVTLAIPGSMLLSPNDDLTGGAVRTLIIAHARDGVVSFQKFEITFNPP
ncbi:MAG: hypothetical protein ABW252_15945 [Polyangiales bacterium]